MGVKKDIPPGRTDDTTSEDASPSATPREPLGPDPEDSESEGLANRSPIEERGDALREELESELTTVGGDIEPPDSEVDEGFDTDGSAVTANSVSSTSRPLAANYVKLEEKSCRHKYELTVGKGKQAKKIPVACGRLKCRVQGHGKDVRDIGYYVRQPKGGVWHGRLDYPPLTEQGYLEAIENEKADLLQAVSKLHGSDDESENESQSSDEEERLRTDRSPRMSPKKKSSIGFDLSTTTVYSTRSKDAPANPGEDLSQNKVAQRVVQSPVSRALSQGHSALAAALGGRTEPEKAPTFWYGLIDETTQERYITSDPEEANALLRGNHQFVELFYKRRIAELWREASSMTNKKKASRKPPRVETVTSESEDESVASRTHRRHTDDRTRAGSGQEWSQEKAPKHSAKPAARRPARKEQGRNESSSHPEPEGYFGVIRRGCRMIARNDRQVRRLEDQGWELRKLFRTAKEADLWTKEGEAGSDSEGSVPALSHRSSKKKKSSKKKSKPKRRVQTEDDPSSSSSSDSSSESSESSDSSSSEESDSSNDSSSVPRRKTRKKKEKRSRKTRSRPRRSQKKTNRRRQDVVRQPYGPDVSVGDSEKIFGIPIDDEDRMDKLLCPPDMSRKSDKRRLAESILDVMALPGAYNQIKEADGQSELQGFVEGAAALVSQATGKAIKVDSQWRQARRAALSKVKTREEVGQLATDIREIRDVVFKLQKQRIRSLLRQCRYDKNEVEEYLYSGLWVRLSLETFDLNLRLLDHIDSTAREHQNWDGGLAHAMLQHHAGKLWNVRAFAEDYKYHLLGTYIYLRDAAPNKFYHTSMLEKLWKKASEPAARLQQKNERKPVVKGEDLKVPKTGCSLCNSKALHDLLKTSYGMHNCPFKDKLTRTKARTAAKEILELHKANEGLDLKKAVEEQIELQS
jgi:hypothetical protein